MTASDRFGVDRPRRRALRALVLALIWSGPTAWGQSPDPCPEYWAVATRACPQRLGVDPWPYLRACRLDADGRLVRRDPAGLTNLAASGRPLVVLVHGSYYSAGRAASEGLRIRDDLGASGALPPGAVVVAFDWPSQLEYANPVRDANEKGRRAFVAGDHLARFLRAFPTDARVCLIGHSHGGLAVLSALHLLGGGVLDDGGDACPPSRLPDGPPGPRPRAVAIAPASDHHWLDPGERLDRALAGSDGVLCLFNPLDPVLVVHPLGRHTDHRRALGRSGLDAVDEGRLGPLACRYRERSIAPLIGPRHTFRGTLAVPTVDRWIAPYAGNWPEGLASTSSKDDREMDGTESRPAPADRPD